MDPIIPKKEEREAHHHGLTAKLRPGNSNGAAPPTLHWPADARTWLARLAIPVVLLLLILVQYGANSREIDALQSRLEALHASRDTPDLPQPTTDNTENISQLEAMLQEQASLIQTLEQRMASQIVELDSLKNATSDNFALLGGAPLRGAGSLDELRESLSALTTRVAALDQQAESTTPDAVQESRLKDWQGALEKVATAAASNRQLISEQQSALQALQDDTAERLNAVAAQQQSSLAAYDKRLNELNGNLDTVVDGVTATLATRLEDLALNNARVEQQIVRLTQQQATVGSQSITHTTPGIDKALEEIKAKVKDLDLRTNQLTSGLDQELMAHAIEERIDTSLQPGIERLDQHADLIASLNERVSSIDNQLTTAAEQGSSTDNTARLATFMHAMEGAMSELNERIDATGKLIAQWREEKNNPSATAEADSGFDNVDGARQQLATQLAAIEALEGSNRKLADDLADTNRELARLRESNSLTSAASPAREPQDTTRLDSLSNTLAQAVARIDSQELSLNAWRDEVDSRLAASDLQLTASGSTPPPPETAEMTLIRETLAQLKKQHPFAKFPDE